eukprot:1143442-Pelagomonas_calceolata.AAC.5
MLRPFASVNLISSCVPLKGPLMERHAEVICSHGPDRAGPDRGGDVLNVGFGLGLVDEAIQVGGLVKRGNRWER